MEQLLLKLLAAGNTNKIKLFNGVSLCELNGCSIPEPEDGCLLLISWMPPPEEASGDAERYKPARVSSLSVWPSNVLPYGDGSHYIYDDTALPSYTTSGTSFGGTAAVTASMETPAEQPHLAVNGSEDERRMQSSDDLAFAALNEDPAFVYSRSGSTFQGHATSTISRRNTTLLESHSLGPLPETYTTEMSAGSYVHRNSHSSVSFSEEDRALNHFVMWASLPYMRHRLPHLLAQSSISASVSPITGEIARHADGAPPQPNDNPNAAIAAVVTATQNTLDTVGGYAARSVLCFHLRNITLLSVGTHYHSKGERRLPRQRIGLTLSTGSAPAAAGPVSYGFLFHQGGTTRFVQAIKAIHPGVLLDTKLQSAGEVKKGTVVQPARTASTMTTTTSISVTPPAECASSLRGGQGDGGATGRWNFYMDTQSMRSWLKGLNVGIAASASVLPQAGSQTCGAAEPVERVLGAAAPAPTAAVGGVPSSSSADSFSDLGEELQDRHNARIRRAGDDGGNNIVVVPRPPVCPPVPAEPFTDTQWHTLMDTDGVVIPEKLEEVRCAIYEGRFVITEEPNAEGAQCSSGFRLEMWCHLLGAYPEASTQAQREVLRQVDEDLYATMSSQWRAVLPVQLENFSAFRQRLRAVEKDVERTDRTHPDFRDDASPKLQLLYNVLMAHVMINFDLGYCQGMSDVAAVVARMTDSEATAFMCYRHIIAGHMVANFSMNSSTGMLNKLRQLRIIVRHFCPEMYAHLERCQAADMNFCVRWLIMCYKREFSFDDVLCLWDTVFACPYTTSFDIFITAAVLRAHSQQICDTVTSYACILQFINTLPLTLDEVLRWGRTFYDDVSYTVTRLKCLMQGELGNTTLQRPSLEEAVRVCEMVDGALPPA